jgi:2-keto-4-pentenoate hydratase/2-oxohepta-3-ene-1,7-dioic acid hydratase in catechol pathway
MQLIRIGPAGRERPAVRDGDDEFDLTSLTDDIDGAFLAADGIARTRDALERRILPALPAEPGRRIGVPAARPSAVIGIGQNYAAHAREGGNEPPTEPIVFLLHPASLAGPTDDVPLPVKAVKADYEVELAAVISRPTFRLDSPEEALGRVAGYTVANDLSERAWQLDPPGGQWSKGKSSLAFTPLGPWLLPADEVPDPQDLRLRSWVNGELRQDSNTRDMIFSVAELVYHLSQHMPLQAGDVVNTGTPEGVALSGRFPFLTAGDVVETAVSGLGRQRNTIVLATETTRW